MLINHCGSRKFTCNKKNPHVLKMIAMKNWKIFSMKVFEKQAKRIMGVKIRMDNSGSA